MEQLQDGVAQVAQNAKATADAYRGDEQRPLGGYVVIMALFGALLCGAAGLASATGRRLPDGVGPWDLVLLAAGFTLGLVFAPRLTRLIAAALTAVTGADFLHLLYAKAQEGEG